MTTQEILFGTKYRQARPADIAKAIGVSDDTVCRWKKDPGKIPLNKLRILIRVQNIPDEQIRELMRMKT